MLFELAFEGTSTWDSINIPRCCAAASQALESYSDFNYARVRSFILSCAPNSRSQCSARRSGGPQPSFSGQAFQLSKIGLARILVGCSFTRLAVRACLSHQIVDASSNHRADRMNGFVAIEPFRHQSLCRASHRQRVIGDLVLDNDVKDGVRLFARRANTLAPMIRQHQIDAFLLSHRKPLLRLWLREWVILPDRLVDLIDVAFGVRWPFEFRVSSLQYRMESCRVFVSRDSTS
jgi:hypothetical protein